MSNVYIPTKINIGFQNRNDTYTGRLAYITYYDEKINYAKNILGKVGEIKRYPIKNLRMNL